MPEEIKIQYDGTFNIAIGRSRKETNWKNKEMTWKELVEKTSVTHRTAETYQEYISSKKSRQDEIKDIGGFVGGYLTGGRRNKGSVLNRQLITLDIDHSDSDFWNDFTISFTNAALLYSTHKHSPETPRLRLVMPLNREVFADEYIAISRKIAGILNIEIFDHTTFEPERLMYWPSTAQGATYEFHYQDGAWLNADEILASYRDWRDTSEWPVSASSNAILQHNIKKQGDPIEKPGIIGAFCRTYSISEAIDTFLDDVYAPCDIDNRYTYKEGSTAAGVVVYEDKYAFSHHGTDPISGKLCNSFDLVRIHKFGLQDEDTSDDTPINKLPSYSSMVEFASKDSKVKQQLGNERLQEAKYDFAQLEDQEEEVNNDWMSALDVDKKGNYYSTINNIILVLNNDPYLKGRIALNSFEKREVALKNLPWREVTTHTRYLTDADDAGLRHYLENIYNMTGMQKVKDAVDLVLAANSFHPVRDYLNSLKWDRRPRIERLLVEYMGAEDSEYVRAVTRKTLAAAVTRIYKPGAKFDYVLTLVGKQGIQKSSFFDRLGKSWFSDSFSSVQGKEAFEQLQGAWIIEIAELSGLKKAEIETIKHFIAKREDRYRVAYGRRLEYFPRQCIFFGTTNTRDFLRDPTGNRRFWPIDTLMHEPTKVPLIDLTDHEIDQIWAEAVMLYKSGEELYLSKELEEIANAIQGAHIEHDERAGLVENYLNTLLPENWDAMDIYQRRSFLQGDDLNAAGVNLRDKVCIAEIWCEALGGFQKEMSTQNTKTLHNLMRTIDGWTESKSSKTRFSVYGLQKAYVRQRGFVTTDGKFVTTVPENRK